MLTPQPRRHLHVCLALRPWIAQYSDHDTILSPRTQARLGKAIAHWSAKAAAAAREWAARNAALAEERGAAARSHRALKAALECFRAQQAERMRELSVRRSGTQPKAQGDGHHLSPLLYLSVDISPAAAYIG